MTLRECFNLTEQWSSHLSSALQNTGDALQLSIGFFIIVHFGGMHRCTLNIFSGETAWLSPSISQQSANTIQLIKFWTVRRCLQAKIKNRKRKATERGRNWSRSFERAMLCCFQKSPYSELKWNSAGGQMLQTGEMLIDTMQLLFLTFPPKRRIFTEHPQLQKRRFVKIIKPIQGMFDVSSTGFIPGTPRSYDCAWREKEFPTLPWNCVLVRPFMPSRIEHFG